MKRGIAFFILKWCDTVINDVLSPRSVKKMPHSLLLEVSLVSFPLTIYLQPLR